MNKELLELLDKIKDIHQKKATDYSSEGPDENFLRVAIVTQWFDNHIDKAFISLITVKLARLAVLLNKEYRNPLMSPKNESIEDSFLDLCTYCALWSAHYSRRKNMMQTDVIVLKSPTPNNL